MKLHDRVAIVTGAGRGIGRGIAEAFAGEGARLTLVSRTMSQVEEVARQVRDTGAEAIALSIDVSKPDDVKRMVQHTLDRYARVDILVNNAGVLGPVGPLHSNDIGSWSEALQINVIGLAMCCHAVLPSMVTQGGGRIINLSGSGVAGPTDTFTSYGTSKAAVIRLTESLALEVRPHNIMVNALGPGQIDTQLLDGIAEAEKGMVSDEMLSQVRLTRSGRGASLEEAAALAVWLASPESEGLTGRMVHAVHDDWRNLGPRIPEIMDSDSHTLRFVS